MLRYRDLLASFFVFVVALVVYRGTLLPDLGIWDTAEYQTVGAVLGIAHPTGFPLYTLVTHGIAALPFDSVAFRINLFSAICAAGAAAGLVAVARVAGANTCSSLAAGLAFAFFYPFWDNAIRAESHTLHMFLVMNILWMAVRWRKTAQFRYMAGAALLTGISLSNHHLTALTVPGTFLLIVMVKPGLLANFRQIMALIGLGALGLMFYLFVPLRAIQEPALNYARPFTWERFRYLFFGEEFRHTMHYATPYGPQLFYDRIPVVVERFGEWFTWGGAILVAGLGLYGLSRLSRTDRALSWVFVVWMAIPLYMGTTYQDADIRRYYFLPAAIALIWAAFGLTRLSEQIRAAWGRRLQHGLMAIAMVLPLALIPTFWYQLDRSDDYVGRVYADRVMTILKPNALLVTWWNLATPLWYVRFVEGKRPDVEVVDTQMILDRGWENVDLAIRMNLGSRPVYVQRFPSEFRHLNTHYELRTVELLAPYSQPLFEVTEIKRQSRLRHWSD